MKRLVRDLIYQKRLSNFSFIKKDTSILEALSVLNDKCLSALLVLEEKTLQGIFTKRDFIKGTIFGGFTATDNVASVMTKKIFYAEPSFNLEECLQVMARIRIRHLPVLENERPVALITMKEIVELLVEDKNFQIQNLLSYISGTSTPEDEFFKKTRFTLPVYNSPVSQEVL